VRAIAVQADASAADFGKRLVDAAIKEFNTNSIDIIVNNAAAALMHGGISSVPAEDWDNMFHVNVRGPFLLIQAALPYMKAGGRIVNISSVIAKLGSYMLLVYGASKGALNALTVALAEELGPKGITINAVAPGPIATDLSMDGSDVAKRLAANQHIKREGTPREVAAAVLFLASPDSSYVSGQILPVDGGIHLP
jgi:3-oxoacyl-[acyl-carrier protein] reductase